MKITGTGKVFKNQYGYSISDNQKKQDGTYENFTIPCAFRRGVEIEDKTKINFEGFTKPYKTKDNKTMVSYFINEFEVIGQAVSPSNFEEPSHGISDEPFADMGEQIELSEDEIGF